MSVFKRPGSPFYHYRFMYNGRRYTGSTGESGPYKARQIENQKMEAVRRGEISTGKAPRLSVFVQQFKTFVEKSAEAKQLAAKTRKYYDNGCRLLEATPVWDLRIDVATSADGEDVSPRVVERRFGEERSRVRDSLAAWQLRVPQVRASWDQLGRSFGQSVADL